MARASSGGAWRRRPPGTGGAARDATTRHEEEGRTKKECPPLLACGLITVTAVASRGHMSPQDTRAGRVATRAGFPLVTLRPVREKGSAGRTSERARSGGRRAAPPSESAAPLAVEASPTATAGSGGRRQERGGGWRFSVPVRSPGQMLHALPCRHLVAAKKVSSFLSYDLIS
jgi:hypothetical protein